MEEKEVKAHSSEKLSYEELENVAHQLSEQNRQLYAKLQEVNISNMFKRLDYLFKVVENASMFDLEFCTECTEEIKKLITIPEEDSEKPDAESDKE